MLIRITESNAWENEKWTYVFDLSKQDASTINYLNIFIRLANEEYDVIKANTKHNNIPRISFGFMGMGSKPVFAASRYTMEFYDSYENKDNYLHLINKKGTLCIANRDSYKSAGLMLDTVLSNRKMKSAMIAMRDKKVNKLYKSFEDIFLKTKKVKA